MIDFTSATGALTEEGKRVLAYAERMIEATDKTNYNELPGIVRSYIALVQKQGVHTQESFARDYRNSLSTLYEQMEVEAQRARDTEQVAENTDKVAALEAAFAKLQEDLGARVSELERENEDLRKQLDARKPGRKAAAKADETSEAPDTEPPAAPETEA